MSVTSEYSDFPTVQRSEQFQQLRSTHRSFVFPMTVVFLLWYLSFVIVAAFFPEFMAIKVLGNINLGIVLGLAQFVTTFIITGAYVAFANKKIDPIATDLREKMEAAQPTATDQSLQTTAHGAGEPA
ncbi:MAG TPA: DUF485 domain-containing protein [Enteractinococcus sp.]